jgi:chromate transporter
VSSPEQPGETGVLVHDLPPWPLFWAFTLIGVRSWGGGTSTIFVMVQQLVKRGWITQAQFALDFGLSRLAPGINLLAVAVMLGYRLGGLVGAFAALSGLMLAPTIITIILTASFLELTSNPIGASVVKGVVPVTAALTFALAVEQAGAIMPWREVRTAILMALYGGLSFVLVAFYHAPVALVILAGIILGAVLFSPPADRKPAE